MESGERRDRSRGGLDDCYISKETRLKGAVLKRRGGEKMRIWTRHN